MPDPNPVDDFDAYVKDAIEETPGVPDAPDENKEPQDAAKEAPKENVPPPESPRWKEVYGNWKQTERNFESFKAEQAQRETELRDQLTSLQTHNADLADAIGTVQGDLSTATKPDPGEEPERYAEWMRADIKRELRAELKQPESAPAYQPPQQPEVPQLDAKLAAQREVQAGLHDDYYAIEQTAWNDMQGDFALKSHIMDSPNPFQAAYQYGKDRQALKDGEAQRTHDQGVLEGAAHSQPEGGGQRALSPLEKKIAVGLGVSEENMLKQAKFIDENKRRARG